MRRHPLANGVGDVIVCNRHGTLHPDAGQLDPDRAALAERTNQQRRRGSADEVLEGTDLLLGLSGPGAVSAMAVRRMAPGAIVFAMANPVPEVHPEEVRDDVAIIATGRSDYPNQINNVLAFPGVFKGALEVRARTIDEEMKLAAARAIAQVIPENELHADYIIPSVFNRQVADSVAHAVADAAGNSGVARRERADSVRDAQAMQPFHRLAGSVSECVERLGGQAQIVNRHVARLKRETPQPADGVSLVAGGVAVSEHQADAERVVERDAREFARGGEHQHLVVDLECPPEANVGAAIRGHYERVFLLDSDGYGFALR